MAAVSHYRIVTDIFAGRHPHGVDSERFLRTPADLAVAVGDGVADPP
jgi:hypothetical protein